MSERLGVSLSVVFALAVVGLVYFGLRVVIEAPK